MSGEIITVSAWTGLPKIIAKDKKQAMLKNLKINPALFSGAFCLLFIFTIFFLNINTCLIASSAESSALALSSAEGRDSVVANFLIFKLSNFLYHGQLPSAPSWDVAVPLQQEGDDALTPEQAPEGLKQFSWISSTPEPAWALKLDESLKSPCLISALVALGEPLVKTVSV
jgi:hypothetical protein